MKTNTLVKTGLSFISLLLVSSAFAATAPTPAETKIENTGPVQKVILGQSLAKALQKFDSKFRLLTAADFSDEAKDLFPAGSGQTPMAVTGDFNGDTFPDFAFFGQSGKRYVVLMAIGEGTNWKLEKVREFDPQDISEDKGGLKIYLSLLEASDINFKKGSKLAKRDALQVEVYRGDTKAYYFNQKSILEYKGTIE